VRRLIALASATALVACASMQAPPGGPQRTEPPTLLAVTPESGAVNVTDKAAVFEFDVIVDDRAGRNGKLENSFIVSPAEGGTVVTWRRDRVEVRPRRGFRPGTAYSVTMLPGVADLSRNAMQETRVITFSTGPTIPVFAVHGRVFDWMAERIALNAVVDVVRLPDSLPYIGVTDSVGQFRVGPLDTGTYTVRALIDANNNGLRDANEMWDTTRVVIGAESPFVELRAAIRDTIAPKLLSVNPLDSVTLTLSFDRTLDPTATVTPEMIRVQRADSTPVAVRRVYSQAAFQRLRATRDSTLEAAMRDSIARADTTRRPPAPAATPAQPSAAPTQRVAPKPSLPVPSREIVIELDPAAGVMPEASYRVTATGFKGLTGLTKQSDRSFTVPKRDTTSRARRP
jgi:hypothetical protein